MSPLDLLWLFFILSSLQPLVQQQILTMRRAQALRALERRNGSRAITLIHRREGFAILGIPFGGYIDIDDSEAVIRAIEMTGSQLPIDLILHTPGGLVLAAFPIDAELARSFNLKVSTDLPGEIRKLMSLYPQPRGRRPSVEYIPIPYQAPARRDHTGRRSWRAQR